MYSFQTYNFEPLFYAKTVHWNSDASTAAVVHFNISASPQTNKLKYPIHRIYRTYHAHIM